MMLLITYDTVARYFFNAPSIWIIQFAEYFMVWICFAGAAWLLNLDGHVSVDFVTIRLNPRNRVLFNIITSILGLLVCAALFYFTAENVWTTFVKGTLDYRSIMVPKALMMVFIPIGFCLLFIGFIIKLGVYIKLWQEGRGIELKVKEEGL